MSSLSVLNSVLIYSKIALKFNVGADYSEFLIVGLESGEKKDLVV